MCACHFLICDRINWTGCLYRLREELGMDRKFIAAGVAEQQKLVDHLIEIRENQYDYMDASHSFFRYRSAVSTHFRDELKKTLLGEFYFSIRGNLNDDFDMRPAISHTVSFEEFRDFIYPIMIHIELSKLLEQQGLSLLMLNIADYLFHKQLVFSQALSPRVAYENNLERIFPLMADAEKVLCVTTNPVNNVMWSMYSSCFNGYCVELADIQSAVPGVDQYYKPAKVHYSNARPTIDYRDLLGLYLSHQNLKNLERLPKQLERYLIEYKIAPKSFLIKSPGWSYEEEYRFFANMQKDDNYISFKPEAIKSITIGHNLSSEAKSFIINTVRSSGLKIKIFETKLSSSTFEILRQPV